MTRRASDELRKEVWDALVKNRGNRQAAAVSMGKSLRTLNRYIHDLNLYADMDKAGMIQHAGPPRGDESGTSRREDVVLKHIATHRGEIDYSELAGELYGADTPRTRQRVYQAINELKGKGIIADDGVRWIVMKRRK